MNTVAPCQDRYAERDPSRAITRPAPKMAPHRQGFATGSELAAAAQAHDFARIRVYPQRGLAAGQPTSPATLSAHGVGQTRPPASTPTTPPVPPTTAPPASSTLAPTLSLANDSYTDSGNTSHKHIGFNVSVPVPLDATRFALVNKIQGTGKRADGSFWKMHMYDHRVDANFPTTQVDSIDADPVYWSSPTARWNFTNTTAGFSATDDPGPPDYIFENGDVTRFKFKIGVYRMSDLPTTTTGSLSATPLAEQDWQYSVVAHPTTGALSHPTL
jgi:hypothetical protein